MRPLSGITSYLCNRLGADGRVPGVVIRRVGILVTNPSQIYFATGSGFSAGINISLPDSGYYLCTNNQDGDVLLKSIFRRR
jgi:hypothetical protein